MSTARIQSTGAIRAFRPALHIFADAGRNALEEIIASFRRTVHWLRGEQRDHWNHQIRFRTEKVRQAKEALRQKQIFRDAVGSRPSDVDEKRALSHAQRQLEEAHEKLEATKRWAQTLDKHVQEFRANTQPLAHLLEHQIPLAVARLDRLMDTLSEYAANPQISPKPVAGGTTPQNPTEETSDEQ